MKKILTVILSIVISALTISGCESSTRIESTPTPFPTTKQTKPTPTATPDPDMPYVLSKIRDIQKVNGLYTFEGTLDHIELGSYGSGVSVTCYLTPSSGTSFRAGLQSIPTFYDEIMNYIRRYGNMYCRFYFDSDGNLRKIYDVINDLLLYSV